MSRNTSLCYIERDGHVLMLHRVKKEHDLNRDKWIGLGGKLEPGESPEAALRRELREELSIDVRVGRIVDAVYHRYPDRDVLLLFYRCEITGGAPIPVDCNAVEWPRIEDVPRYDFADADRVFVERNL